MRAESVACVNEGGGITLVITVQDAAASPTSSEPLRVVLPYEAAVRLAQALQRALHLDAALDRLAGLESPAPERGEQPIDLGIMSETEASAVCRAALVRVNPDDSEAGFALHARDDGRFDWSIEPADPLRLLYSEAIREALGPQAGDLRPSS